jgi:tRNA pseudouridine55 synthase
VAGQPDETTPSGVVVVDKQPDWTSHQVVGRMRRLAGTRKVGHAGTLDPMATGVLLVGIGKATRLLGYLGHAEKRYRATIRLGVATVTDDAEGDVTQTPGAAAIDSDELAAAVSRFTGAIDQVPSAVSAIKVGGVRSYARVRSGEQVDLAPRPVTIHAFELWATRRGMTEDVPVLDVDVEVGCSPGTYVRALARDLGAALDTAGHLTALRRTRVGSFGLDRARTLTDCETDLGLIDITDVATECFDTLRLDDGQADWVRNGRRLPGLSLPASPTALVAPDGQFVALYRQSGPDAVAEAVFV